MPTALPATLRPLRSPCLAAAIVVLFSMATPARANFELVPRPVESAQPARPAVRPASDATAPAGAAAGAKQAGTAAARPAQAGGANAARPGKPGANCNLSEQVLGASELRADGSCR